MECGMDQWNGWILMEMEWRWTMEGATGGVLEWTIPGCSGQNDEPQYRNRLVAKSSRDHRCVVGAP